MQSGSSCTSPRSGGRRACSRSPSASRRQQLSTTYTWVGSTRGRASLALETMSLFVDEKVSAAHRALARGGRFLCDRLWRCAVAARTSRRVQPRAAGGRVLAVRVRCGVEAGVSTSDSFGDATVAGPREVVEPHEAMALLHACHGSR